MTKFIKKTDFLRWALTVVFLWLIFKDAGFIVGLFAVFVSIEIELSTLYRRIDMEWKKTVMEGLKSWEVYNAPSQTHEKRVTQTDTKHGC